MICANQQIKKFPLRLLGTATWLGDDTPRTVPEGTAMILGYLAMAPNGTVSRAELAEILWSDITVGRNNLRQALSRLKKDHASYADWVTADATTVRLEAPPHSIDAFDPTDFLCWCNRHCDIGVMSEPILLAGLERSSPLFEDWLREKRVDITDRFVAAARGLLATLTRARGANILEIGSLCRLLSKIDPLGADHQITAALRTAGRVELAAVSAGFDKPVDGQRKSLRVALMRPQITTGSDVGISANIFYGELVDRLSAFRTFSVVSVHSSFRYEPANIDEAKDALRADFIAVSNIFHSSRGLTLGMRLLDMSDDTIAWAAEFAISPDIMARSSAGLVRHIAGFLGSSLEAAIARNAKELAEPSAFLHFLRARDAQGKCDLPSLRRSRNHLIEALRLDEGFALARAQMAGTLVVEWILRGGRDHELLVRAEQQSAAALNTDGACAMAHWMSGSVALYQRRYDSVESAFDQAEALAPHSADLLLEYGDVMSHLQVPERAEIYFQRALDLNPEPPVRYWWFGASIALSSSDFALAADRCDLVGDDDVAVGMRTACYAMNGDLQKASIWAERTRDVLPDHSVNDLVELMPGDPSSDLHRNYAEGLRSAGLI
ncbi:hypothetical protein OAH97_01105 [Octadecabacter sp.]|nr:hypothetical protein [Octadecabacter sp.]